MFCVEIINKKTKRLVISFVCELKLTVCKNIALLELPNCTFSEPDQINFFTQQMLQLYEE